MFFTFGRLAGNETGTLRKRVCAFTGSARAKIFARAFAFFLVTSRRISRITSVERNLEKMKTFIVYDLDSKMPVAVGEQVSAETARYCASVATGIFEANLLAEEIDLEKQITY